ncbi:MAG TPA: hypothetical protein VNC22_12090 [Sporichthya sp.]|nr:hypothetical protein [Sporichthya sp.]
MNTSRKLVLTAAACAAALSIASPAQAASALQKFGTGDVIITGSSVTIANDAGEYGGVYLKSKSASGKKLSAVDFSFANAGDVGGGAPRFSLPIDTDNNGTTDGYAFIDVNSCGGAALVSTDSPTSQVYFGSDAAYANWNEFTAAHPTWRSAPGDTPFVIADVAGSYSVTDVSLRQ